MMSQAVFYFSILLFHKMLPLVDPSGDEPSSVNLDLPAMYNLPKSHQDNILKLIKSNLSMKDFLNVIFAAGFQAGYVNRTFENFFIIFNCAIQHGKATLGVFKDYEKIYSKCESYQEAMLDVEIPEDISDLIRNNDAWIEEYDKKKIPNGYFTTPTTTLNPNKKPVLERSVKVLSDVRKQLRHWYCIVNYTAPIPAKSSTKTSVEMSPFILKLQKQLKAIQQLNPEKYSSTHEIFLRFSALSGRSYKMFCTVYHKLLKHIMESARSNKTAQFSDILFYYVPSWIITPEQLLFFNVVRRTLHPEFPAVKNITLWNANPKGRNVTLIPYDDSKFCNQVFGKEPPKETSPPIKDCTIPLDES